MFLYLRTTIYNRIFTRYAREKPKKSEEKKAKRAKRDEAQHSMKVRHQISGQLCLAYFFSQAYNY